MENLIAIRAGTIRPVFLTINPDMTTDYKRKAKLLDAINILIIIAFALLVAVLVVNPMSNPYKLDARWEKIDSIISAYNVVQREVDSLYEVIENKQSMINDQDWQIQIQDQKHGH